MENTLRLLCLDQHASVHGAHHHVHPRHAPLLTGTVNTINFFLFVIFTFLMEAEI